MREVKHPAPSTSALRCGVGQPNLIFIFLWGTSKNRSPDGLLPVGLSASLHTFLVSDPTQSLTFLQTSGGGQDIYTPTLRSSGLSQVAWFSEVMSTDQSLHCRGEMELTVL